MRYKTYLVGGAVRDEFLGVPSKDQDFVVLAPSFDALKQDLLDHGCKIFIEKPEYNTIRARHPFLGSVDFSLARKDGEYSDGRHPDTTSITTDLVEDLSRRDYTCNAIAKDVETGEIVDPFNGRRDIEQTMLRAVGNATQRLNEDRLRAFRAVRFSVTKGLTIDHKLNCAIRELMLLSDFECISTARIYEELIKMFKHDGDFALHLLKNSYPVLWDVAKERGIWLKPTLETI